MSQFVKKKTSKDPYLSSAPLHSCVRFLPEAPREMLQDEGSLPRLPWTKRCCKVAGYGSHGRNAGVVAGTSYTLKSIYFVVCDSFHRTNFFAHLFEGDVYYALIDQTVETPPAHVPQETWNRLGRTWPLHRRNVFVAFSSATSPQCFGELWCSFDFHLKERRGTTSNGIRALVLGRLTITVRQQFRGAFSQ